jgi:hypothetical protein
MQMGSNLQLEFERGLGDRNPGAGELVLRALKRTNWFYLTLHVSIAKVRRVRQPKWQKMADIVSVSACGDLKRIKT